MASPAILTCQDVSKNFSGLPALSPVSLSLEEGEHLAIVGPTGSGKTTLLRILAGLLEPSTGKVFDGAELVNRPGWRFPPHRRQIGMLFQGLALWPHLTVRKQVELSLPNGFGRAERKRALSALLSRAGLEALSSRYPGELSGGERQRVAWARAIASEPKVLFLDEPLTSLDPALREELLGWVHHYGEASGHTVVIVTHDEPVARRVGRRVLELKKASA